MIVNALTYIGVEAEVRGRQFIMFTSDGPDEVEKVTADGFKLANFEEDVELPDGTTIVLEARYLKDT
jgi:hypothetical protein